MKNILYAFAFTGLMLSLFSCEVKDNNSIYHTLKEGFLNPSGTARPKAYWWWLNGNVDTVRLKAELLAMKKMGIGGADIFEIGVPQTDTMIPAGPAFMSEASLRDIQFAIKEAAKLDLEIGFNVASSWNAGGSWTLPQHAAKSLYFSKIKVKGPGKHKINLPFPEISRLDKKGNQLISLDANGKPVYYEEVAVLAIPTHDKKNTLDTTNIINLSAFFDAEHELLDWQAPAGEWEVHRYVCANSGEQLKLPSANSHGPIIDHFDSTATQVHFMYIINHLKPLLGNFHKTALKSFYLASYEATEFVWTSSLPVEFKKNNGYDMYKLIPALFNRELFRQETTERFHADFRKTLSELMINNLYKKAKEIVNSYGLKINSEAGGPGQPLHNVPVEPLKALGALDIPRGEFWNKHYHYNKDSIDIMQVVKEIAAASHIYNRGIVEEESFTSFRHWQEGPFDLKPLADRAFCEGMNRVVIHGFSHNPAGIGFPGIVYHAGTHFNDKRVWWPKIKPFIDYLARISYMLQEANFVADVLYYYGDQIPNFVAPKNTRFTVGPGYDYEVINTEILLKDLTVKDGQLMLPGGARFKLLSLGEATKINPDVLDKLGQLARQGAIIIGAKPEEAIGLRNQPEATEKVKTIADSLWIALDHGFSEETREKGKIFSGITAIKVLEALQIPPDFSHAGQDSTLLDYIHYQDRKLDFYLLRNTSDQWISRFCSFRQQNKTPEIWDPVSGKVSPVHIYHQDKQQITLPLSLPPYGTYLLVFKQETPTFHYQSVTAPDAYPPRIAYTPKGLYFLEEGTFELNSDGTSTGIENHLQTLLLEGAWQLSFPKNWGAPDSVEIPELISWTEFNNEGIKYFSGTATYHKTFQFNRADAENFDRVMLDLGELSEVAEVWLNNQALGITWAKPHVFDVTNLLKEGDNTIKVEVANTWSNRLTGDALTGENYTNTNISIAYRGITWDKAPLLESGLLGPVTLTFSKVIQAE